MTTPVIVGSFIGAVGLYVILRSKIGWVRRGVIAGMLAASIGIPVICWPSMTAYDAQRSLVIDTCSHIAELLVSFRTEIRTRYPPGIELPALSDPNWNRWNELLVVTGHAEGLCLPDSSSCNDYDGIPPGNTPKFMHALDVLVDAIQHHRSCPTP